MDWTTIPPAAPGWYWTICEGDQRPYPRHMYIAPVGEQLCCQGKEVTLWSEYHGARWWPVPIEEPTFAR